MLTQDQVNELNTIITQLKTIVTSCESDTVNAALTNAANTVETAVVALQQAYILEIRDANGNLVMPTTSVLAELVDKIKSLVSKL